MSQPEEIVLCVLTTQQHAPLAEANAVADVKFCFVFPTLDHFEGPHIVPLHQQKDHQSTHHAVTHELLQYFAKPQEVIKGGFFISAEEKTWSNETTIDEPWMIESYFKALIPILKKKLTGGAAYPFWPTETRNGCRCTDAVEAEVDMYVVPGHENALILEHQDHHSRIKVMTKRIKVSLKDFAANLVWESEGLLKLMEEIDVNVVGEATMKKFPSPGRLAHYIAEVKALI